MAAGKFGSSSVAITCDDGPGGTSRTITPYVDTISEIAVEAITEQTNPFASSSEAHTPSGMSKSPDITLEGWFDTTATLGPHVVFVLASGDKDPQGSTRSFTFTPGDSKLFSIECRLVFYGITATNGKLSRYKAILRQAAAGAWT